MTNVKQAMTVLKSAENDHQDRKKALAELVESGDPGAIPVIMAVAAGHGENHRLRKAATAALGEFRDPAAVAALIALRGVDDSKDVPIIAVKALGDLRDPSAVEPLILMALSRAGCTPGNGFASGTDIIVDAFKLLRLEAIRALGKIDDPKTIGPLTFLAITDLVDGIPHAASAALRTTGWNAPPDLEDDGVWRRRSVAGWSGS